MFALSSYIEIENKDKGKTYYNIKPIEVKINKSIHQYADKAIITLPLTALLKQAGKEPAITAETAKQFSEGNKVTIKLGYNGVLQTEFIGFINRVNRKSPVELECEGYSYQLRRKQYVGTYEKEPLLNLLQILVADTDIKLLTEYVPKDYIIEKMVFGGDTGVHDGADCLDKIIKSSEDTLKFFFDDNKLYVGLAGTKQEQVIKDHPRSMAKYKLGWNVIKDNNLKLKEPSNIKATVNSMDSSGKKTKAEVEKKTNTKPGAKTKTIALHSTAVTHQNTLILICDALVHEYAAEGYDGSITAFGVPYCQHNWVAAITDDKYPERNGNYLIESVDVSYSTKGYRRTLGIAVRL